MMRTCDQCSNWAQWRGTVKKEGAPTFVRILCQIHKDADKTPDIKFIFVGAIPLLGAA